jgi:CBS domain-containing protein
MKRVFEIMTTRVATIGPDVTLETVRRAFEQHPFHHLPVLGPEGKVIGIVSDRDLVRACVGGRLDLKRSASSIMTQMIVSVAGDATVVEAAQRLVKLGVNSLVVLDEAGKLRGILTSRDIVKATAAG